MRTPAACRTATANLLMSVTLTLVVLALLAAMLLAGYAEWASRMRDALHDLRRRPQLRRLTVEEDAALASVRVITGRTHEAQVRTLSGAITAGSGFGDRLLHSAWLDDVAVLLPFDAWRHLADDNQAEVVLAGDCALVVRLNGFHIVGAHARVNAEAAAHDTACGKGTRRRRRRIDRCNVLGTRLESDAEVALRRGPSPYVTGLLIAVVAILIAVDSRNEGAGLFLLILAMLATWTAWPGRRGPKQPQRVLLLDGILGTIILDPRYPPTWMLGSDHRIELPPEWLTSGRFHDGRRARLEIRATDGSVLGAGPGWSLVQDRLRFPQSQLLRHLVWLVLILGLLAIAAVFDAVPRHSNLGIPFVPATAPWWFVTAAMLLGQLLRVVMRTRQVLRRDTARDAELAARPPPRSR